MPVEIRDKSKFKSKNSKRSAYFEFLLLNFDLVSLRSLPIKKDDIFYVETG